MRFRKWFKRNRHPKNYNVEIYYPRSIDVFVGLSKRSRKGKNIGADSFLSIHCDGAFNATN